MNGNGYSIFHLPFFASYDTYRAKATRLPWRASFNTSLCKLVSKEDYNDGEYTFQINVSSCLLRYGLNNYQRLFAPTSTSYVLNSYPSWLWITTLALFNSSCWNERFRAFASILPQSNYVWMIWERNQSKAFRYIIINYSTFTRCLTLFRFLNFYHMYITVSILWTFIVII